MNALRLLNLGVRFFLELASLIAFGFWGWTARGDMPVRGALAIATPLAAALFWGLFIAPRARIPTGLVGQAGLGLLVFVAAAAALAARGQTRLALVFGVISVASSVLLYALAE